MVGAAGAGGGRGRRAQWRGHRPLRCHCGLPQAGGQLIGGVRVGGLPAGQGVDHHARKSTAVHVDRAVAALPDRKLGGRKRQGAASTGHLPLELSAERQQRLLAGACPRSCPRACPLARPCPQYLGSSVMQGPAHGAGEACGVHRRLARTAAATLCAALAPPLVGPGQ